VLDDRTAINNPAQGAAAAGTSIKRNLLGDIVGGTKIEYMPSAAGGLGDFRRSYQDNSGQTHYLELKPNERKGDYSDSNRDAWRAKQEREAATEKARLQTEKQQGILNARYEKEFGLKFAELQSQIAQVSNAHQTSLAQIGLQGQQVTNQGKQIEAQTKLGQGQLSEQTNARIDANTHRTEELGLTRQQMQLNNQLQQAKLLQESQQFERQHALDEKNNRRTQVMGALTLIAQSAAKF
jgi:hypothetical protein